MMQHLIGSPSVSSVSPEWDQSNAQIIDHLADWCETAGFRVERLPIAGHPGKFNLVASIGSGPDGLVLSGHTDTVPYDDSRWRSDPFALTERDRGHLTYLAKVDITENRERLPDGVPVEVDLGAGSSE